MSSLQGDGRTSPGENRGQRRWLSSARACGPLDGKIPRPLPRPGLRTRRMEAGARPAAGEGAPTPAEGGAAARVGQVRSLSPGVSAAAAGGSDCSLARAGRAKRALGLRIQLWEAGLVFQTLPRKKVMEAVSRGGFARGLSVRPVPPGRKRGERLPVHPASWRGINSHAVQLTLAWPGGAGVRGRKRGLSTCPVPPWRLKGRGLRGVV